MNQRTEMPERPSIQANALAQLIEAAPSRVRKRLDRDPSIADQWKWNCDSKLCIVTAGEETVTLKLDEGKCVGSAANASCSCLLSPKCFHVLACATSLPISREPGLASEPEVQADEAEEDIGDGIVVTDEMQRAASHAMRSIESVLTVGARASGVVLQSSLLQAAHQCRAQGLINLANSVIRVAEGIQRLRSDDDHTDTRALRADIVLAVGVARELIRNEEVSKQIVGAARRVFAPVDVSRVTGIVAEPVLTLSGYAGVCTHLVSDCGRIFQVTELRPGDASLIGQAYRGGMDLGATTMSAKVLSRSSLDVQNLTASADGRLGKGSKTRWATRTSKEAETGIPDRFMWPLSEQIAAAFGDVARPGSDLVSFCGTIIGADGPFVVISVADIAAAAVDRPMRLSIAIDDDRLEYRRNLELLARCRRLSLRVIGRLRMDTAGVIDALSISASGYSDDEDVPKLTLPKDYGGRCHLGIDRLERHHVTDAQRVAVNVQSSGEEFLSKGDGESTTRERVDLFPGLSNRLTALVIGGKRAITFLGSPTHRRDRRRLTQRTQVVAAQLLDAIARSTSASAPPSQIAITLAAADTYCNAARMAHQHDCWQKWCETSRAN